MSARASRKSTAARRPPPAKQPSYSPEAKVLSYSRPPRRIPSPTNILSIDRRDGEDDGLYPAQPPTRRPPDNFGAAVHIASHSGGGHPSASLYSGREGEWADNHSAHDNEDTFFFYNPSWTRVDDNSMKTAASPSPRANPGDAGYTMTSTPSRMSTRVSANPRELPFSKYRAAFNVSPASLPSSSYLDNEEGHLHACPARGDHGCERRLRRLLRRYVHYVEDELEPQMKRLEAALKEKEAACTQLHADNVILTQQLQRLQSAGTEAKNAPPVSAALPSDPTLPASSSCSANVSEPITQGLCGERCEADQRLCEASAEVVLLKRQLETLQGQYKRLVQDTSVGSAVPPLRPALTAVPSTAVETDESKGAALAALCNALSEDGLGFTVALSDAHERRSRDRGRGSGVSGATDSAHSSPRGTPNPFKAAVDEWRCFARLTASTLTPTDSTAFVDGSPDILTACTAVLKALATTLQTEHGAVAAEMEVAQQAEKHHIESVARHQHVVEQVRREAECRIEELEADHEAEVQALENTISELKQQVSVTAASWRLQTAGLLVHRPLEAPAVGAPLTSIMRNTPEARTARRESVARNGRGDAAGGGGGTAEGLDSVRRAAGTHALSAMDRAESATQTPLSLEWINGCLQKAREGPMRSGRREKEAELFELMSTEIEMLRLQLADSNAVAIRLREAQRHFAGDVTLPLNCFDNISHFTGYV
ncbi:hypothetical protein ABL78_5571 [Leptomonas seymouri]|uniref:Uncharacterized protein n=1 Tax=Leptomonas seymouri TaxID=5684 RepID=A0A0N1HWP6_LEPSE|nr:hypothetical protein ABL78_5571 [Leptomonas seymouri]|eukprot:KPI85390.1 hypothetical protein ABL78_5571 [Leptomonas seymouri]